MTQQLPQTSFGNMRDGFVNSLSLVLSSIISKKYQLDYSAMGSLNIALTTGISYILVSLSNLHSINIDYGKIMDVIYQIYEYVITYKFSYKLLAGVLLGTILIFYLYKTVKPKSMLIFFKNKVNLNMITYQTLNQREIYICTEYIKKYPNIFKNIENIGVYSFDTEFTQHIMNNHCYSYKGTPDKFNSYDIPNNKQNIYFEDKNFNISGYFYFELVTRAYKKKISHSQLDNVNDYVDMSYQMNYMIVSLYTCKQSDIRKYLNFIEKDIESSSTTLYISYHNGPNMLTDKIIYKSNIYTLDEGENLFIKPFFSKKAQKIWNVVKMIHTNPSTFLDKGFIPRASYILYGPPGCGKSDFIKRIALALRRNIRQITVDDLSSLHILRSLFDNDLLTKTVFIIDEFDYVLRFLISNEKHKNARKKALMRYYEMLDADCMLTDKNLDMLIGLNSQSTQKVSTQASTQTSTQVSTQASTQGTSSTQQSPTLPEKTLQLKSANVDDIVGVNDLLSTFQGVEPNVGLLLFATTNDLKYINDECPTLIRPGRFTPVELEYMNRDELDQMIEYYFSQHIDFDVPNNHTIPSSQIIELVYTTLFNNGNYDEFKLALLQLFEPHNIPILIYKN